MTSAHVRRPHRLSGVRLAARRDLSEQELQRRLGEPGSAVDLLTADLAALWDHHRSDEADERRTGVLELHSGAYVQWIGYGDVLVVECSSSTYLPQHAQLTAQQEAGLLRAGFQPPDVDEPNFWLVVAARGEVVAAAFSVVAALTAVFGVYAG